ncbi:MAG: SGNH/GDSL hydrolase family protein [Arenicellales bacterium]
MAGYAARKDKSTCRIAFLGDSFTEAVQVAYENSFVGLLDKNSDCAVRNYGTSSYSPIFYLLQWRQAVRSFEPSLVILQLYSNDIYSDQMYSKNSRKNEKGEVIAIPGHSGGWVTKQLRKSYLARLIRKTQLQLQWIYENWGKVQVVTGGVVEENSDISELSAELVKKLANEV